MQTAGIMFLDNEPRGAGFLLAGFIRTARLGRFLEIAFSFVLAQAHPCNLTADCAGETDFGEMDPVRRHPEREKRLRHYLRSCLDLRVASVRMSTSLSSTPSLPSAALQSHRAPMLRQPDNG